MSTCKFCGAPSCNSEMMGGELIQSWACMERELAAVKAERDAWKQAGEQRL